MSPAFRPPSFRRRSGLGGALALGAAFVLVTAGLVRSQPAPPQPAPAPASLAPTPPPALRDDQVQLLTRTLAEAPTHGFRPGEFAAANPDQLRAAVVAYAQAQHGGRVKASQFHDDWGIRPQAYDAEADFNFALNQDKLADWLASLPPPFERYRALRTALAQYRAIAARGGWEPIADGPPLKPGMSDPRVVQLRKRLAAENAPGSIELTSPVYDPTLAAVVSAAQGRYGLDPDGVVAGATLRALNTPVEARIDQIAANMERWRWMPRDWPATRVEVNIPSADLVAYQDNKPVAQMKVVVGAPDKKTPMLRSEIHSVVFNPPWNVPHSIASKELVPKGAAYLKKRHYAWVPNGAGGSRLQQKPGPWNSLGRIKFDFNNPYGVYLHDTDEKTAFGKDARSISHGCVRVEKPQDLANLLLDSDSGWTPAKLDQVLAQRKTLRAMLPQKTPVLILYWTVFVSPDGQVNFRGDEYHWDDQLSALLNPGKATA